MRVSHRTLLGHRLRDPDRGCPLDRASLAGMVMSLGAVTRDSGFCLRGALLARGATPRRPPAHGGLCWPGGRPPGDPPRMGGSAGPGGDPPETPRVWGAPAPHTPWGGL